MNIRETIAIAALAWGFFGATATRAQNATTPLTVTIPYPTLSNLSVEWEILGDDDLDGVVTVRYRVSGTSQWRDGLPLRRVPAGSNLGFAWANKHSGSILDLTPGTEYEIELSLTDPDGGSDTQIVEASTRPVPQASPTGDEILVTPATFSSAASSADPGDILILAAGDYSGFTFDKDGNINDPIVIRSGVLKSAVVNGDVRLDGRSYVFVEGLTVNGMVKFNNSQGIVVRGCTINTTNSGIVSTSNGVTNGYFADNLVLGPTNWSTDSVGANGDNLGEGIQITGPGNVIEHNYVKGFRDAISTMEDSGANNQVSVDILNNDIEVGADDAIEADFTMGNSRVMRNRITNSFVGLSSQPSLGGPAYFIRNVMYNIIYSPFKLHRGSVGDVAFHNTVIKCGDALAVYTGDTWSRALFRNNLFIGGQGGGNYGGYSNGSGRVAQLAAADTTCHFNYDGFGSIGTGLFSGRIGSTSFSSLTEMRANTSETDGVEVDMDVFENNVDFPVTGPFPERTIPVLTLKADSVAVDKGEVLANINDGFEGSAPDLGAYELGTNPPTYGPRATDNTPPKAPTNLKVIVQ